MQEKSMQNKLRKSYPFYDLIFGTHTLHKFPEDLYKIIINKNRIEDILDIDGEIIEGLPIKRNDKIKASVTIMNGCNNFCTYCIVPYVRGRERSRDPIDIINEIEELAKKGFIEVTLLGQNVNSYKGNGNLGIYRFSDLLKTVNKIDGIQRIRFISPHPKDFTDDVIEAIRDCEKVCKIIHLPLQSGSTEILKSMNRHYTKSQYLDLVQKMKNMIPELELSTDIIVGFPGETEEDFDESLSFVKRMRFYNPNIFPYSRRQGTKADKLPDQLTNEVKHARSVRTITECEKISKEIEKEYFEKYKDRANDVLIEEQIEKDGKKTGIGYTKEYVRRELSL